MSNRRKISLAKLAEQLTGAKAGTARPRPQTSEIPRFPRIPAERLEELLDDAAQASREASGCWMCKLNLPHRIPVQCIPATAVTTAHVHGRPQA